jgi:hypothetical protein
MGHRPRRGYEAESGTDALTLSGFHAGAFKPPSRFPTYAFRNDQEPAIDNNLGKNPPHSRMATPPGAHHLVRDLAGIADRRGLGFSEFMTPLARPLVRLSGLVGTHASATIAGLTILHDLLPDSAIRQLLQRLRLDRRKIWIVR